jgi:N-acetylmuramoyl-L-alanine amidase
MKFGIDYGHNCPPDTGARGIRSEDVMTKDVGTRLMQKLKALGHQVVNCVPSSANSVVGSLSQRCNIANSSNVDLYVSIHFNAFNGSANGTEIFAISDSGRKYAQPVLNSIVKLGYFNRGVKNGSHLYVLRNTDMPSILIECAFCDNQKDMSLYDPEKMANAILEGLTGKKAPDTSPTPSNPSKDPNIVKLQQALNRLKITDKNGKILAVTGIKDAATESATQRFQKIVNLSADGIAGPITLTTINQIFTKPILRPNHASGPVVRYLQFRVGVESDGIYGNGTAAAVAKFQKANGLTADGIIGPQSWTKLIG